MFPMQTKTDLLSIRTTDEKSKEIGIVEKLSDVDEETGKMLLEQLELRYFMPVIKKVIQIKSEFGYAYGGYQPYSKKRRNDWSGGSFRYRKVHTY
ncbi:MAG: DUF1854 domain-containing protein [Lachnospiraceae bacterium]|nr:DUF1854 domain-containing protein [Lachnospiraceae bacterium]